MYLVANDKIFFKENLIINEIIEYQKSNNNESKKKIEFLLEDQLNSLNYLSNDYSFYSGFSGIGCLIEYCKREGLIEVNTEIFLEDFDDQIYKYTMSLLAEKDINHLKLFDIFNYFYARIISKNNESSHYKTFHLFMIASLIIRKIFKNVINKSLIKIKSIKINANEFLFLSAFALKLSYVAHLTGFDTELMLFEIFETFYINSQQFNQSQFQTGLMLLSIAMKQSEYYFFYEKTINIYKNLKNLKNETVLIENMFNSELCNWKVHDILSKEKKIKKFFSFYLLNVKKNHCSN